MVQPRRLTPPTLHSPYALERVVRQIRETLPFAAPAVEVLQQGLLDSVDAVLAPDTGDVLRRQVGATHPLPDPEGALIEYLNVLSRGPGLRKFTTPEELFKDVARVMTSSLRSANDKAVAFEREALNVLAHHAAITHPLDSFFLDPAAGLAIIEGYQRTIQSLLLREFGLHTELSLLEETYRDPDRLCLKARGRMHRIKNRLLAIDGPIQGIILHKDNPTLRAQWLDRLRASMDETLDPFSYLRSVFPQVIVLEPRRSCDIPEPLVVREILLHLVRNSIDAGATKVWISYEPPSRNRPMLAITVLDDGRGVDRALLPQLGTTPIQRADRPNRGNGLFLVRQELLPDFGPGANIEIDSPVDGNHGTLVTLFIPPETGGATPDPAPRRGNDVEGTAPIEPASSAEGFGLPIGLAPALDPPGASDSGPLRIYDAQRAGGMAMMGFDVKVIYSGRLR